MAATDFSSLRDEYDNFLRQDVSVSLAVIGKKLEVKHAAEMLTMYSMLFFFLCIDFMNNNNI